MNVEVIFKVASRSLILIENKQNIFTYMNSCPHIGTPLDLKLGNFLSPNKEHIICSTHGALFTIDTGKCIFGPCKGERLKGVPNIIKNDCVYVNNS